LGTGEVKTATSSIFQRFDRNIYTHVTTSALLTDNGVMYMVGNQTLLQANTDVKFKALISTRSSQNHYALSTSGVIVHINDNGVRNATLIDANTETKDGSLIVKNLWDTYFVSGDNQLYQIMMFTFSELKFRKQFSPNYFNSSIVKIVSGDKHHAALLTNGVIMVWGSNEGM
jgi:alpha-tubulin suppressor-like RCC1 family protein